MPPRVGLVFNVLPKVAPSARRILSEVVRATAFNIEADARHRAPVDTGFLRSSIQAEQVSELAAEIAVGAEYGAAVEFGTGTRSIDPEADHQPIVIRPRTKKALFWPGAEHPVAQVVQEGQPPRPYFTPAVDAAREPFERACAAIVEQAARKVGEP